MQVRSEFSQTASGLVAKPSPQAIISKITHNWSAKTVRDLTEALHKKNFLGPKIGNVVLGDEALSCPEISTLVSSVTSVAKKHDGQKHEKKTTIQLQQKFVTNAGKRDVPLSMRNA